jgi:DNA-binding transcriptional ArsR family regulator
MSNNRRNVTDYPSPDLADVELVDVMRALSDPTRLEIVRVLADGAPHNKGTTDWGCDVQKPTMSHHFRILREAGVTRTLVDGRTHAIQLRREELDARFPGLLAAVFAG